MTGSKGLDGLTGRCLWAWATWLPGNCAECSPFAFLAALRAVLCFDCMQPDGVLARCLEAVRKFY